MSLIVFALLLYLALGVSFCLFLRDLSAGRVMFDSVRSLWQKLSVGSRLLFCLLFAVVAVYGSSKPGSTQQNASSNTTSGKTSVVETSAQCDNSSASASQQINTSSTNPSLPTRVWHDDPTDSDADGIPDKRERWTYSDPLVPNADVDRDNDGLSELNTIKT